MNATTAQVLPVTLSPMDRLYYVSRERGGTFITKPYVMHTALYYAFGVFKTRFRCKEQTPFYKQDRDDSETTAYIHPATATETPDYETRRFAVKADKYRTESEQENRNLMETGYQKTILPEKGSSGQLTYQTFVTRTETGDFGPLDQQSTWYIRVGKKMTPTLVQTGQIHKAAVETGSFTLGQPIAADDIDTEERYDLLGDLRWERMNPVDLIVSGRFQGPHVMIENEHERGPDSISLPVDTEFLTAG